MKRFNIKRMIALMLSVAMLLTGIPCNDIRVNADEYSAVSAAQEVTLPDGKVGTLSGSVEINKDNVYREDSNLVHSDPQPENGVGFTYTPGGRIRNRIRNFNGTEGTVIANDTLFLLEYEASEGFDLSKLTLEGTKDSIGKDADGKSLGWDNDYSFTLKSNNAGLAVYSVSAVQSKSNVLHDIRLKASDSVYSNEFTLIIKDAYFVSDIHEAAVVEEPGAIAIGEKRIAGDIKGTVIAFSEANTDNYKKESGNFKPVENQPDEGVQFVYTSGGKIRNRIKNFTTVSGPAVEINANVVFVLEYESTGNFAFDKLEIQATSTPLIDGVEGSGWDDGFSLSVNDDKNGIAIFSIIPGAGNTALYDVRFKGNDGVFEDGTTLTIRNAYFLTDIEPAGTPDPGPEPVEGFAVGAKKTVGKIEGTITGIVKADIVSMIMEADEPDMQLAAVQPEDGVKFEKTSDGKVRNRFFVNERAGADIAEGDKFVIEFDASADFDLTKIALFPQNESATTYADNPELVLDGDIVNGVAVYSVPASYKDGKIYAIRLKSNAGEVTRGAWVTFKAAYFLTDVKNASTQIDPNENPVGKDYAVGDLSGKISGYVKLNTSNVSVESGCDLKISADQPDAGIKLEKADDVKIRNRFYVNEKAGVVVHKGDRLIIDREIFNGLELENIDLEPQLTGPDAFDNPDFGKPEYMNTVDGKAIYKIPDSLDGKTIYALRGKANAEFVTKGSSIIIKGMYFITDVVDNSEPAKPACPYDISENVQGISVTYYNDIFSRGVAWRTKNIAATDSALQIVNMNDVDDISTFWWNTDKVTTIPDNFGAKAFVNDTKDAAVYYCHKAHIENLSDKNTYYYRVGSESSGWSKPGIMKINSELDDFTFIHVTDPQATSESEYRQFENLLRAAYKKLDTTGSQHVGTFNTGDITNECHDGKVFIDEFNMAQDFDSDDLMNTVIIPVAGNHDVTEDIFWSMYDIDFQDYCADGKHNTHRTGACYSYQVGNVFILGTNSNESGNLDYSPANGEYDSKADYHEQYNWIVSELQRANELRAEGRIKWIIYLTHAGMMSVGYHTMDGGSKCLRTNITPLLAEYEVDLVLQGHDHAYTRTVPYYYGEDLNGTQFTGYQSNERETFKGYGDVSFDNPYTAAIETEGDRIWNVEPEGTHYITINYAGTKSLEISKDNAEARYQMPDQCILDGIAVSPVNGTECGLKFAKQFFALVRISGDVMTYDTYSFSGGKAELFDTFTVIKDGEHQPDLDKQEVEFTGVYVEDKEYDGKAARLETDDILAVKPGTEEEDIQFTDYDKIVFSVTGTLADGSEYTRNDRLPKEVGTYTLHVTLSSKSAFFKGETTIEFSITEDLGISDDDDKDYIGGLTAASLPEDEEDDPEPVNGGQHNPVGGGTIIPHFPIIIVPDDDETGEPSGQVDVDNPQTPEGTPSGLVDIDNPETPEGAADAAEEVEGTFFKKDKQFTGKKLTGFDVEAGGEDAEYPKEIKVKVDSKSIGKSGKTLYLYKVDKSGNKLLETDVTKITVDEDGYATFTAYEEGEFVLLSKAASKKTVITLAEQITVNKSVKVKAGKTKKNAMGLELPAELKGAKVEYSSSDKKVVKISKKSGKITAVKKGKATITVKVTMPDGTVKKYKTKVTVK